MKSKKTREKILDASLQLFNEKKASNVSTVQISAAMKISPGNLYYYFANKEEVIRCIWNERMVDERVQLSERPAEAQNIGELLDFLQDCFEHYEKYRFFYNEVYTLFSNDSTMEELYDTMQVNVMDNTKEFLRKWIQNEKMVELSENKLNILAENIITLMDVSISKFDSDEARAKGFEAFVKMRAQRIMALLDPYFTDDIKAESAEELGSRGWVQ